MLNKIIIQDISSVFRGRLKSKEPFSSHNVAQCRLRRQTSHVSEGAPIIL